MQSRGGSRCLWLVHGNVRTHPSLRGAAPSVPPAPTPLNPPTESQVVGAGATSWGLESLSGRRFLGHPATPALWMASGCPGLGPPCRPEGLDSLATVARGRCCRPREEWRMAVRCGNALPWPGRGVVPPVSHGFLGAPTTHPAHRQQAPCVGNLVAVSQELMCLPSSRGSPTGSPT